MAATTAVAPEAAGTFAKVHYDSQCDTVLPSFETLIALNSCCANDLASMISHIFSHIVVAVSR